MKNKVTPETVARDAICLTDGHIFQLCLGLRVYVHHLAYLALELNYGHKSTKERVQNVYMYMRSATYRRSFVVQQGLTWLLVPWHCGVQWFPWVYADPRSSSGQQVC